MSLLSKKSLARKLLKAKKYRDSFVSARITQTVALQVRVLRQQRVMSQAELAEALGTSQNAIYRLENPNYGKNSISTLKKVASFFDVGLVVRLEKYSDIVDWVSRLDSESILVPSAGKDARLRQAATSPTGFHDEGTSVENLIFFPAQNIGSSINLRRKGVTHALGTVGLAPATDTDIASARATGG